MGRTIYNGTFDHNVDEKRRVAIPARWRPASEGYQFTLFVNTRALGGQSFIKVVTKEQMEALADKLDETPAIADGDGDAGRWLGEDSDQVDLDKSGRITIPEKCAAAVGITHSSEVKMVGTITGFEIWNPTTYASYRESRSKTAPLQLQQVKLSKPEVAP